jgi:putative transposase
MIKKSQKERAVAVQRFIQGENPEVICASTGKSPRWLYKWVAWHPPDDPSWCEGQSRRPHTSSRRTPLEIVEIVEMVRWSLYNKGLFCGNQAIQWEMEDMEVQALPSLRTISRILFRRDLI